MAPREPHECCERLDAGKMGYQQKDAHNSKEARRQVGEEEVELDLELGTGVVDGSHSRPYKLLRVSW